MDLQFFHQTTLGVVNVPIRERRYAKSLVQIGILVGYWYLDELDILVCLRQFVEIWRHSATGLRRTLRRFGEQSKHLLE